MNCFYHPQTVAVAICKNCHKAICVTYTSDVGNGVACKGKCEEEVSTVNDLVARNQTAHQKAAKVHFLLGIPFVAIGFLMFVGGLISKNEDRAGTITCIIFRIYGHYFSLVREKTKKSQLVYGC